MSAWTRESWASAQINSRCNELERDLRAIRRDLALSLFQRSVLSHIAVEAAAEDLQQYDWFKGAA